VGRLIYTAITSLDGYVADESGKFDWAAPDAEVHEFVNEQERSVGAYLYGRRMYDVMHVWQTMGSDHPITAAYAEIWRAADKVVYSTTLDEVRTPRTRIARTFDADEIRAIKAGGDVSIGGPTLAAEALRAGLVDEIGLFLNPVIVGGGNAALPDDLRLDLELVDEHRFGNGVVFLRYLCARRS
jgi:dihydrofolate reductase